MPYSLTPWSKLTRFAVPTFRVSRRAFTTNGESFEIGDEIPASLFRAGSRLRQLYEQRLIEPVPETVVLLAGQHHLTPHRTPVSRPAPRQAATSAFDFDLPATPVHEESRPTGYTPSKQKSAARKGAARP